MVLQQPPPKIDPKEKGLSRTAGVTLVQLRYGLVWIDDSIQDIFSIMILFHDTPKGLDRRHVPATVYPRLKGEYFADASMPLPFLPCTCSKEPHLAGKRTAH